MKKLSKKKIILFLIIPVLIIADILVCTILYFVEPIDYVEADLHKSSYSLELYDKYSYDKNSDFYIKQITANDVVSYEKDLRLKYIDGTIMLICDNTADLSDISALISSHNGTVCGYISYLNLYQIEFPGCNYEELLNICSEYDSADFISATCVDYFEETPPSDSETEDYSDYEFYADTLYKDIINYPYDIHYNSDIIVGIFDSLVDNTNSNFNIINSDTYNREWLDDSQYASSSTHGTHVAGIACCSSSSLAPAVYPDGSIVSDNAFNNSISYWIAALTDMIVNYNVSVINLSMGYNTYISLSANLGCENALWYIENESYFFEKFLEKLIDCDYEFLICIAAGNESSSTINKIPSHYFSFGDKKLLDKLDIFNIFTKKIEYADAKYSLPFASINNEEVRKRIIIVGSCDNRKQLSYFSDAGNSVDIVAPGEGILSFVLDGDYEMCSGTSMASPFVAGTAALVFSYDETLTASEVRDIILNSSTESVSGYGFDYPLLNVGEAVASVK